MLDRPQLPSHSPVRSAPADVHGVGRMLHEPRQHRSVGHDLDAVQPVDLRPQGADSGLDLSNGQLRRAIAARGADSALLHHHDRAMLALQGRADGRFKTKIGTSLSLRKMIL